MTREQARDAIRAQTENYLCGRGLSLEKPFRCLNPNHPDNHPSMRYDPRRKKVHCFACGADYDIFDLIGMEHGLKEMREVFDKAYEIFRVQVDGAGVASSHQRPAEVPKAEGDHTAYFALCAARIGQTDYPQRRGLSQQVTERFQLGFDPAYNAGGAPWKALIIPTGKGSYIARNTDPNADKRNRYRKQGTCALYNRRALQAAQKPVFIVEGEIDALSIMTQGGEAVALGSVANIRAFVKLVEAQKPTQTLLLAMDNDEAGQRAAQELSEALQKLQVPFYRVQPYGGHKDANEALTADPADFAAALHSAETIEQEAREAEREAYANTSAGSHLYAFMNGIAESASTPVMPTGFDKLDSALDGGLYEGLYIVGAISSLGKTTLICQMADQIARQGGEALIFSLEMARSELMAKSISRLTLLDCLTNGKAGANAKTARGITTGSRYSHYSKEEQALIYRAVNAYAGYAGRVYIHEGMGDIGVEQVRQAIRRHMECTGNRPLVVIDYLQILSPYSERFSDKQNTDKAVMELKRISRDYKIPVIGISSFNRANYKEAVTMEAFKESGAIEYSSDVLLGLQLKGAGGREFDATAEKKKNPRQVELVVLKNRNGAAGGTVTFDYYPMFNYFREGK